MDQRLIIQTVQETSEVFAVVWEIEFTHTAVHTYVSKKRMIKQTKLVLSWLERTKRLQTKQARLRIA